MLSQKHGRHIDAPLARQPLVKGEILVCLEVNAVIRIIAISVMSSSISVCEWLFNIIVCWSSPELLLHPQVGSSSQANYLMRDSDMDDSIEGS